MADDTENRRNRIPVHFADEDDVEQPKARDDNDRDANSRSDEEGNSSVEVASASNYEHGSEEQSGGDRTPEQGNDIHDVDIDPPVPVEVEVEDFEATPVGGYIDANQSRSTADAENTGPVLAELIATRAELRRVEAERAELRESLARRQADFENYRKRVERERTESYNRMVGEVVTKLLPVLDNLRRALEAEGSLQASESEEFRHFLNGVQLIYKQLSGVLKGLGLQAIPALGHRFDPHVHEAVVTEQTEEFEPDTVIEELVPGYRLGEKLIRPAIVKVATR